MTRRRWIADRASGDRAWLVGANAAHLARALRARVGQEFEIAVDGHVRLGRVSSVSDEEIAFDLAEEVAQPETARTVLLLAVFKFDRMEWAIEKATELGVSEIVPVIARRTDPHLAHAAAKRVERWRRIAHEAAQQARRAAPPEIFAPAPLRDCVARVIDPGALRIVLAEDERSLTLREALCREQDAPGTAGETPALPADVTLAVGPEGGWTAEELADFARAGWVAASLGKNILRAETAAIFGLAIVNALR